MLGCEVWGPELQSPVVRPDGYGRLSSQVSVLSPSACASSELLRGAGVRGAPILCFVHSFASESPERGNIASLLGPASPRLAERPALWSLSAACFLPQP